MCVHVLNHERPIVHTDPESRRRNARNGRITIGCLSRLRSHAGSRLVTMARADGAARHPSCPRRRASSARADTLANATGSPPARGRRGDTSRITVDCERSYVCAGELPATIPAGRFPGFSTRILRFSARKPRIRRAERTRQQMIPCTCGAHGHHADASKPGCTPSRLTPVSRALYRSFSVTPSA